MAGENKAVPKVAVITRTKNRNLFLERAIKGVESQTYKNYVHLIFNDGGDKKEVESLLSKYKSDKRKVVHNEKSVGLTAALNQGIRAVDSEYIAILDDDDSWEPELLEKTVAYLDKSGEKAVVVKMDIVLEEVVDGGIRQISRSLHPESGEGEINLFKQCYKNYVSNGNVTYRRNVYEELGGYDESLEVGEDWDFGIRLLMKCDVGFLRDEKALICYHQRPSFDGDGGNSVHAGVATQEKTINIIRNRYLREDLKTGRLGVGYIMNKLAEDSNRVVRVEGHINYAADRITKSLSDDIKDLIRVQREEMKIFNRTKASLRDIKRRLKS